MLAGLACVRGDVVPDAINWGNISDTDGSGENADQTFAGLSQGIPIRATISDTAGSGVSHRLYIVKDSVDGEDVAIADGNTLNAIVITGTAIHFRAQVASGGPKTCTVTVANLLTGASLDTFTVSISI